MDLFIGVFMASVSSVRAAACDGFDFHQRARHHEVGAHGGARRCRRPRGGEDAGVGAVEFGEVADAAEPHRRLDHVGEAEAFGAQDVADARQAAGRHIADPAYFHKVVDCQWACPAHTPVPEYIRLIAQGRYGDAYMVNWVSNVFPGILGRTCDRPCEPACRRGRVEEATPARPRAGGHLPPQARGRRHEGRRARPHAGAAANGKRVACVGAGPASLTVARDLAPLGYEVTVFDGEAKAGGFMRTQIPRFRLPESVIDEETGYILDLGVEFVAAPHRLDEGAAGAGLRRGLRRLRRAARARPGPARPPGGGGADPHRHRLAGLGLLRPRDASASA
jgi:hypothetical protein